MKSKFDKNYNWDQKRDFDRNYECFAIIKWNENDENENTNLKQMFERKTYQRTQNILNAPSFS